MKKIILLLALCFIATNVKAQFFELTSNGFINSEDHSKDYVVFNFEGEKQQELFNYVLQALGKTFVSPKNKISPVEYTQISANVIIENVTYRKIAGMRLEFDMFFNIIFEFKDEKIRINAPQILDIVQEGGKVHMYLTKAERPDVILAHKALFYNNGKVNEPKHKERIEMSTNAFISNIIERIKKAKDSDW